MSVRRDNRILPAKTMDENPSASDAWLHDDCFACGEQRPFGLHLKFHDTREGAVFASFACERTYQGYTGILHGGITATLLDCAMIHCLFRQGVRAVTVDLRLRYQGRIQIDVPACIQAWITTTAPPLHLAKAELRQHGVVRASGTGKFVEISAIAGLDVFTRMKIPTDNLPPTPCPLGGGSMRALGE